MGAPSGAHSFVVSRIHPSPFAPPIMRSFVPRLLCALVFGITAAAAPAQTVMPDSGARVRVQLNSDSDFVYVGRLLAPVRDSIIMHVPGQPSLRVARSEVRQLQVGRRGSRAPRTFAGIGIGVFTGAAFGALVGSAAGSEDDFFGPEFAAALGASFFGIIGGVTGGIIGYNHPGTAWRDVPVSARVGARGARVSIAF